MRYSIIGWIIGILLGHCIGVTILHYTGTYDKQEETHVYVWSVYSVCSGEGFRHKHLAFKDTVSSLKGIDISDTAHNNVSVIK